MFLGAYTIRPGFEIFPPITYFLVATINFQICSLQAVTIIQESKLIFKKDFSRATQIYVKYMVVEIIN